MKTLLFLALLAFAGVVNAATYYVANSGSDSAAGTSSSVPWQTLAKVNATALSPGDSVLLQRGGTWRESITNTNSGSSGSPITFGAYGVGALPILYGSDALANASFVLDTGDTYYISHLSDRSDATGTWEAGLRLSPQVSLANCRSTAGSSYYDHAAQRRYVHSANADPNPVTNGLEYEGATRSIVIDGQDINWTVWQDLDIRRGYSALSAHLVTGTNNIVQRCVYAQNGSHHLSFYGANNLGTDLYGLNCAGGAFLFYTTNCYGSTFRRLYVLGDVVYTAEGVQTHNGATNNVVEDSWLNQTINQTTGKGAITAQDASTSIIARRNRITGNWQNAIAFTSSAGIDSYFQNNLIVGTALRSRGISMVSGTTGLRVFNNTFYTTASIDFIGPVSGSSCYISNNLVWANDFYTAGVSTGILSCDFNLWFGTGRASPFNMSDTGALDWAGWQAATFDASGTTNDPALLASFTPPATSVVVNKGADIGVTVDFFNRLRVNGPDIGAIEWTVGPRW